MAMNSSAIFKPYTDDFGHLTLHATILGDGTIIAPHERQARLNAFMLLAFLVTFILVAAGIYTVDQALFQTHSPATTAYAYNGIPIDTD